MRNYFIVSLLAICLNIANFSFASAKKNNLPECCKQKESCCTEGASCCSNANTKDSLTCCEEQLSCCSDGASCCSKKKTVNNDNRKIFGKERLDLATKGL